MAGMNIGLPVRENAYQQALDGLKSRQLNIDMSKMPNMAKLVQGLSSTPNALDEAEKRIIEAESNTPNLESPTAIQEPGENAYTWNSDFINQYVEKPLDEETKNKRIRGAYTRSGVGALGNALNAFSNLYFTSQGAPSQTLPNTPDAHPIVKDFKDEQRKVAENYLAKTMQARQLDKGEYAQDYNRYLQNVSARNQAAQQGYQNAVNAAQNGYNRTFQREQFNADQDYKQKGLDLNLRQQAESERHNKALEQSQAADRAQRASQFRKQMEYKATHDNKGNKILTDGEGKPIYDNSGNYYSLNENRLSTENMSQIVSDAMELEKRGNNKASLINSEFNYKTNGKTDLNLLHSAFGVALKKYPELIEKARGMGMLEKQSPFASFADTDEIDF